MLKSFSHSGQAYLRSGCADRLRRLPELVLFSEPEDDAFDLPDRPEVMERPDVDAGGGINDARPSKLPVKDSGRLPRACTPCLREGVDDDAPLFESE